MNTVQRIAKNTAVLLAANTISKIIGFFYIMYTARYLGVEGFGVLSFALAFTGLLGVFDDLGLNTLMVREIAREKSLTKKYLSNVTVIKIILVIITFSLITITINLLGYPNQTIKVVYFIALSVIFNAFSGMFYSIFRAYEKMEYQSLGQILSSVLMLAGALFAISQRFNVIGFASIYFIVSVIALGYSFAIFMWKFSLPKIEIDWEFWKRCFKEAWPLGIMSVCIIIRFRIDTVMLSLMKGDAAVGLYNAAYKILNISVVAPGIFMASIFPVMSQYYNKSTSSFNIAYEKSFKFLIAIALPMALAVTLLSGPIINLIYGVEFAGSADALRILIWAAVSMYVSMLVGNVYVAANKQMLSMKITIVSVILNIILNLILIPRYSYLGASATTVVSEVFGLSLGIFFLNIYKHKLNVTRVCFAPFLGILVAGAFAILLNILYVNIFLITLVSIILYGMIVYKIGIKDDDKQLIKKLFDLSNIKIVEKEDL